MATKAAAKTKKKDGWTLARRKVFAQAKHKKALLALGSYDMGQTSLAAPKPDLLDQVREVRVHRQAMYGDPTPDFTRIAAIWSGILGVRVAVTDVPLMMIGLKVARAKGGYHEDNMIDVCGYADTHEVVVKGGPIANRQ